MCWGRWKTSRAKKGGSSSSVHTVEKHSMRTTWFRSESGVIRPREADRGRRRGKGSLMKDGKDRERERERSRKSKGKRESRAPIEEEAIGLLYAMKRKRHRISISDTHKKKRIRTHPSYCSALCIATSRVAGAKERKGSQQIR